MAHRILVASVELALDTFEAYLHHFIMTTDTVWGEALTYHAIHC